MVKKINRLSARTVATLTKPGRHADGGGLYLLIDKAGAKRWVFLFERAGRQREAGLGGVNSVPLAKAREIAAGFRELLRSDRWPPLFSRRRKQVGATPSIARNGT